MSPRTQTPVQQHDHRRDHRRAAGRVRAAGLPDRRGVDRHADRVHRRLARRDHPAPTASPTCPAASRCRLPGHPVLSILACAYILASLHWYTWLVFAGWVAVFLVFYLLYGRKHSVLGRRLQRGEIDGRRGRRPARGAAEVSARDRPVGYMPAQRRPRLARSGLQLAHALGEPVAVVTVVPRQWSTPSLARVDAEYGEYAPAGRRGRPSARRASTCATPASRSTIDYRAVTGRSVASALSTPPTSSRRDAGARVVGRRRRWAGSWSGRPPTSCCTPRPSRWPSARAGTGRSPPTGSAGDLRLLRQRRVGRAWSRRAARWPSSSASPLRVASFGVRGATMYPPEVGLTAEDSVLDSWAEQAARGPAPAGRRRDHRATPYRRDRHRRGGDESIVEHRLAARRAARRSGSSRWARWRGSSSGPGRPS